MKHPIVKIIASNKRTMSRWEGLPRQIQDDILFQLPVEILISFCQIAIFKCHQGVTEFDEAENFWKRYKYLYIKHEMIFNIDKND